MGVSHARHIRLAGALYPGFAWSISASVYPLHSTLAECGIHSLTMAEFLTEQYRYSFTSVSNATFGQVCAVNLGTPVLTVGILRTSLGYDPPPQGKSPVFKYLEARRSLYACNLNIHSNGMVSLFGRGIEDGRHITFRRMFGIDVLSPWWPRFSGA